MKEWIIGIIIFAFIMAYFYNPNFFSQIKEKFTEVTTTEKVSISEIIKNPQNYINKTVTVIGNTGILPSFLIDDQGYTINLDQETCQETQRVLPPGKYKAKGIIYGTCECKKRCVVNVTKEEWNELCSQYPGLPKEDINTQAKIYPIFCLILPSAEEGWFPGIETKISECKTSLYAKNYTVEVDFSKGILRFNSEILEEKKCEPNSMKIYLKCTEPLIKIS
jgi:hypothetical protein